MDLELKNKVVLITGAAGHKGSIGETIVQHLVAEGAIPAVGLATKSWTNFLRLIPHF